MNFKKKVSYNQRRPKDRMKLLTSLKRLPKR
jgi:hypothetical protein